MTMTVDSAGPFTPIQPDFQLFQAFASQTDAIFWVADPATFEIVYMSPHAETILGLPHEALKRPSFWQTYLYPVDVERVLSVFGTAVASLAPQQLEYRMQTPGGTLVWFRDTVCLLTKDDRLLLCGLMIDVTSFKTAVHRDTGTPGYTSHFLEIVTLLSGNQGIEQRLNDVAEKMCQVLGLTAVNIFDWDANRGIATQLGHYYSDDGTSIPKRGTTRNRLTDFGERLASAEPVLLYQTDTQLTEWEREQLQKHRAQTLLYVPLMEEGDCIGWIELIQRRARRLFTQSDIKLSQTIAQEISSTIVKARLFQAEANRRREAEILLDVAEFVSSSLDRDEVLNRVMEILRVYLSDVHSCSIGLLTANDKSLETILSWWADDLYALARKGETLDLEHTFTSQLAIKSGEPVVFSDLREIPFTNEVTSKLTQKGLRSILCVPLKIQNRPIGTLQIHYWHYARQFSSEEVALVQGVANQAAIAIENARLFTNERRQLHLSRTLQKVGALLTTSLPLEDVYEQVFELLQQVVTYELASLYLFDKEKDQFFMVAGFGFKKPMLDGKQYVLQADHVRRNISSPLGWRITEDVMMDPNWLHLVEAGSIRSWIGALLLVKGEPIGLLNIDHSIPGFYSNNDGYMVSAFANQAAVAIENARLYDETMRQAKELAILNQISQETAVSLSIDTYLEKITETVGPQLYPTNIFGFVMLDAKTQELTPYATYCGIAEALNQDTIPLENSIVGQVFSHGQPYYAPNVLEDPYYVATSESVRSQMAIPLKVNNEVIGVIHVQSPDLGAFSNRDIDFLMTLAGNITAVIERAKLYETLRLQTESLAEKVALRTGELKLERDRLFAILESAGEGIILTDTQAHILYANPAMERQSGYTRAELRLQNPRILGSNEVPKATFTAMWDHLLKQQRWVGELVNRHKEGHPYDVAVAVTPIADAMGKVTGYVSVQSDITRLKELERLKTEFIANVSHQLRTPLTNIKTYVSLLKKGKPEKFPRYFAVLHFEIDRLARLIQDLLDISRLDAEAAPDPKAATDFCDFWELFWPPIIERAAREHRDIAIMLPEAVAAQRPSVFMEAYQLEKVLFRLIENALAYSKEGDAIHVTVGWCELDAQTMLEIKVCDEGPGIPADERPFIFDRFFRGAQAIEAGLPGNGLGLAIVRELLEQYGGESSLQSELGKGSCFTIQLALAQQTVGEGSTDDST